MSRDGDDLYVGYLDRSPAAIGQFTRRIAIGLVVGALAIAGAVIASHGPFAPSFFEFLVYRDLQGTIHADPYPALRVPRPGDESASLYPLVGPGKWGADALVDVAPGSEVRLSGSLLYRDQQTWVELVPDSIEPVAPTGEETPPTGAEELGMHTLIGEIVDSKCYVGLMNPGDGKTHRGCAARCISGGIPPMFVADDGAGGKLPLLLVSSSGESVGSLVLDRVAEPLEIRGRVTRLDDQLVLWADPSAYRRLAR